MSVLYLLRRGKDGSLTFVRGVATRAEGEREAARDNTLVVMSRSEALAEWASKPRSITMANSIKVNGEH